jgi:hypothetical protein
MENHLDHQLTPQEPTDRNLDSPSTPWWRRPDRLVFIGFVAVAGFFLVTEHRAHFFGALPWLLLLGCPLMHIFMHHGHGHHHRHSSHRDQSATRRDARNGQAPDDKGGL